MDAVYGMMCDGSLQVPIEARYSLTDYEALTATRPRASAKFYSCPSGVGGLIVGHGSLKLLHSAEYLS